MRRINLPFIFLFAFFYSCQRPEHVSQRELDNIAQSYVKLSLGVGQYSPLFVDAYYGPESWRPSGKKKDVLPYEEFKWQCMNLMDRLKDLDNSYLDSLELLRYNFLNKQLLAVYTELDMMAGKSLPFDVESMALYDAVAKEKGQAYYDSLMNNLDRLLPGSGDITERYLAFRKQFIIPIDKVDTVFKAAIAEARKRVKKYIKLPDNESFTIEYVQGKPWSGYNWFKGDAHSVIQVNTDLPISIDKALDLACHEGYPGHHVYNTLLEDRLVKNMKWYEFQIYPLFTPQSLIAEGSANYGIDITFPLKDRIAFEKHTLFPLASLDIDEVEHYYLIKNIRKQLRSYEVEIARKYLSNQLSKANALIMMRHYFQFSPGRALQRLNFYLTYRSYIINYSVGEKLIKTHVEEQSRNKQERWHSFMEILSTPRTASTL